MFSGLPLFSVGPEVVPKQVTVGPPSKLPLQVIGEDGQSSSGRTCSRTGSFSITTTTTRRLASVLRGLLNPKLEVRSQKRSRSMFQKLVDGNSSPGPRRRMVAIIASDLRDLLLSGFGDHTCLRSGVLIMFCPSCLVFEKRHVLCKGCNMDVSTCSGPGLHNGGRGLDRVVKGHWEKIGE